MLTNTGLQKSTGLYCLLNELYCYSVMECGKINVQMELNETRQAQEFKNCGTNNSKGFTFQHTEHRGEISTWGQEHLPQYTMAMMSPPHGGRLTPWQISCMGDVLPHIKSLHPFPIIISLQIAFSFIQNFSIFDAVFRLYGYKYRSETNYINKGWPRQT